MKFPLATTYASDTTPPESVQAYISVKGERSVFTESWKAIPDSPKAFHAKKADRETVRRDLEKSGFIPLAESPLGLAVTAAPGAFEELTGAQIQTTERLMYAEGGQVRYVTHLDLVGAGQPATLGAGTVKSKASKIDGLFLERPKVFHAIFPSPIPPTPARFYLRVPYDIAYMLGATYAHQVGVRGDGVQVVMPDSGQYRHPFFIAYQYSLKRAIAMVPGTNAGKDPVGHGTGESANIFALAPGATVQPIRATNAAGDLVAAMAGFMKAKELKPHIITNSWGGDANFPPAGPPDEIDLAIAMEIQDAIDQGILVIFSAGNGHFSIEPQVPGVLAAGGTYLSADWQLLASDYASGYDSPWFPGVRVPTVCGMVGPQPRAQYIMLPVPPASLIDQDESQPALPFDPLGDGTTGTDGWALFSGTSAAAPQLAGVAALILHAKPGLKPAQIIEAMTRTALDITRGTCHPRFGYPATLGPDIATGLGFVNATAAISYAVTHF